MLGQLEGRETADLVSEVAQPVVSRVIGSFMGIPPEDDARWAALMNSAFAGLSQGIALLVRKEATMIAIANFIGLPLFFLSSTLISIRQVPHWMQIAAKFNPVNWGVIAARQVVLRGTEWGSVGLHLALLFGLSVATAAFATWTFRAYQRTI